VPRFGDAAGFVEDFLVILNNLQYWHGFTNFASIEILILPTMSKKSESVTTVFIEDLGSKAEGRVNWRGQDLNVPFALPGEQVDIIVSKDNCELIDIKCRSGARREPVCQYFGECGGCALQHLDEQEYLQWKRDQIIRTLSFHGVTTDVSPVRSISAGTRRRTVLSAKRTRNKVLLGYHRYRDTSIVPIGKCPVLVPEIEQSLKELGSFIFPFLTRRKEAKVTINQTASGLDIAITGARDVSQVINASSVLNLPEKLNVARLTVNGEPVLLVREPVLEVDGISIPISPGAFIQATKESEQHMLEIVLEEVGSASNIADLFCGSGTFSLPVARHARVTAFESDTSALEAIKKAYSRNQGLKTVETVQRDLFRDPLSKDELKAYDMVIIDPPRAGAHKQSMQIAGSDVQKVMAVSCNPSTFSRDARILIDGGYELAYVVPIDQFLFSHHIELVAKFIKI